MVQKGDYEKVKLDAVPRHVRFFFSNGGTFDSYKAGRGVCIPNLDDLDAFWKTGNAKAASPASADKSGGRDRR